MATGPARDLGTDAAFGVLGLVSGLVMHRLVVGGYFDMFDEG